MTNYNKDNDPYLLSSVNNSLRILELFMVRDNLRLKDISEALDLDRTSTFKMLYTLCHRGFLYKDSHACYQLGPRLAPVRKQTEARNHIVNQASSALFQLYAQIQKTVLLCTLGNDGSLLVLYNKTERNQDSIVARIGATMNVHSTGAGKVLTAFMDPEMQKSFIDTYQFTKLTENTIIDAEDFRQNLEDTKKMRWGIAYEENREDHCDLAVPVFDYTGACVAAVAVVTDRASMDENLDYYLLQLQSAAAKISGKLGYTIS